MTDPAKQVHAGIIPAQWASVLAERNAATKRLQAGRSKLAELLQVLGTEADRADLKPVLLDLMRALEE